MTQSVSAEEVRAAGGLEKWAAKAAQSPAPSYSAKREGAKMDSLRNLSNSPVKAPAQNDITLTLSFPPSVNHYWRHVAMPLGKGKKGFSVRSMISAKGREYKLTVCREVIAQRAAHGITTPVRMYVAFCPPDKRRRDVDNYAKALLDSLVEAKVLEDDSLIRDLRMVWGEVMPGGRAVVTIRKMAVPPEQGRLMP